MTHPSRHHHLQKQTPLGHFLKYKTPCCASRGPYWQHIFTIHIMLKGTPNMKRITGITSFKSSSNCIYHLRTLKYLIMTNVYKQHGSVKNCKLVCTLYIQIRFASKTLNKEFKYPKLPLKSYLFLINTFIYNLLVTEFTFTLVPQRFKEIDFGMLRKSKYETMGLDE